MSKDITQSDESNPERTPAAKIAKELSYEFELSYRSEVNLEAIANKLMQKFTPEEAKDILDDVISNIETLDDYKRLREKQQPK